MSNCSVKLSNYAEGKSDAKLVTIGELDIYFSYETPIAFNHPEMGTVGRVNDWKGTTAKHMNAVPGNDPKKRICGPEFEVLLNNAIAGMGI